MIEFLTKVLYDYCTLHELEYISADELLYESDNDSELDCYTKLTSEQQDWLSSYIKVWDVVVNNDS
jgi:hypothetical protein